MKKIILTFLFIAILISPISASAMSIEKQYERALIEVINLLVQQVEELIKQLNELQRQIIMPAPKIHQTVIVEKKVDKENLAPAPFVRPNYNYNPATPSNHRCHPGAIDILKGDKNCK